MTITVPADLLPADGRFGAGPSRVRSEQLTDLVGANPHVLGTSHRQAPVKDLVGDVRRMLTELYDAPQGYEVVLGNGGATVFWDAATFHLIHRVGQFAESGEFGAKFANAAKEAPWLDEPEIISNPPGTSATPLASSPTVDTYAWVHNETSTGVVNPVERVQASHPHALMVVDGTSAAGGIRVDLTQVDAYYFSLQKGFGAEGGLWFAFLSPAAIARVEELSSRWCPASLSLANALTNSRNNQTLNTPAVSTLVLLRSQLEWMLSQGGLDFTVQRCEDSSSQLYSWAEASAFASPWVDEPYRSPVVATIDFVDEVDAARVAEVLRANGIVDVEPYRKLGRNQIRVGTFPSVAPEDVERLVGAIDFVVERLGS